MTKTRGTVNKVFAVQTKGSRFKSLRPMKRSRYSHSGYDPRTRKGVKTSGAD